MSKKDIKIFITATEQSGDNIGSNLMKSLKTYKNFNFSFHGIGGDKMIKEGLEKTNHISEFKSLGLVEIIINLNSIFKILNSNVKKIFEINPDLILTIDSPDFSFRLVEKLKAKNFNSIFIHMVAPTVWAWRPGRAKYISKLYDLLLTILPFENVYFEKHNLKSVFIGNPICSDKVTLNDNNYIKDYIALLPGSRINEINKLLPYIEKFILNVNSRYKNFKFYIPTLPHLKNYIENYIKFWKLKPILSDHINEKNKLYCKTKFALVCSGTAALEMSSLKIPIIVIYKLNIFTELIFKLLVKVKYANLINIMAKKEIIPEIINSKLTNNNLFECFNNLINSEINQKNQIYESQIIIEKLYTKNDFSFNASNEIIKLL